MIRSRILALSGAVAIAGIACSSSHSAPDVPVTGGDDAGSGADTAPPDPDTVPTDDGVGDAATPPPSGDDDAGGAGLKIKYVVVLIKENHTFDNYFTGFPGAESATTATLSTGKTLTRPVAPNGPLSQDICHANSCGQKAYAGGKMNGFDLNNAGTLPFIHYTEAQIPNYWQYARNFVLADHFFSTTLGPSTPGHTVFWAGRSLSLTNATCHLAGGTGCTGFGCTADKNTTITAYDPATCTTSEVAPCFDVPSLTDHLPAGFTWADYGGPIASMIKSVHAAPDFASHFHKQTDFSHDIGGGHLANLTIAHLWSGDTSEHPVESPCPGENFTVNLINDLMKLPQWKEMAIVVTWDDWGGFYDHVPPKVEKCKNGQIFQQGFRLPAIIVSPYAKKGFVLKTPTEQASVPRLVEELWSMPFMTTRDPNARDGTAGSLLEAFDFTQAPRDGLQLPIHTCQ